MKHTISILFLFLFCVNLNAQRDTIPLNSDWQFSADKKAEGINNKWFEKNLSNARSVNLPHTWNIEEENQNHYGWAWYQKKINIPANWKNKKVVLQFGAINHTSYIYVNGKKAEENIGDGFNKFFITLDGKLNYGRENVITVAVNNAYSENKVPFSNSFDWPNDGGLIRKVTLIVSNKPAASYIHAEPKLNIANNEGRLKIKLGFDEAANSQLQFAIKITEENQPTTNTMFTKTLSPVWQNKEAMVDIILSKVNPWHFDFANLYRIDVTVMMGNKAVDKLSTVVGFREIQMEGGQIFLNGESVKLMGVEWSAGSNPNFGFAEPDAEIIRHCKLMKNVNTIFTRMHFQQDELFYDFCDRNGIIVQQEIPLWGPETPANNSIHRIATKQLERMISNFYNHVSVFSWAAGNELRGRDADVKQLIDDLLKRSRELDPGRMTAYVSNTLTSSFYNNPGFVPDGASQGDYLMMNEYGGSWWAVPPAKIGYYLDSIHMSYPGKTFIISEFGLCEPNFKGGDERRIEDMIYHMSIFESKPFVQGAIYFDLTDYRTHYPGTPEKNKYRRRIHGVYDMYGNPKPSMKVLRELSSPLDIQAQNSNGWKKGKIGLAIFGSIGLPQHTVKGYKLYVSVDTTNYLAGKMYALPEIKPGEQISLEVDAANNDKTVITLVRANGYVASQKIF